MSNEGCPYEPVVRAGRCEGCCALNGTLTPCVAAWLKDQLFGRAEGVVVPLYMVEPRPKPRAA